MNLYHYNKNKYLNLGKSLIGGNADRIFSVLKKYLEDDNMYPVVNIKDLSSDLPYTEDIRFLNCHLGQRKLLLTEIEFYARFVRESKNKLVIYAGSASCEHLPAILELFPDLKFILVDPNYHAVNAEQKYIYQRPEIINQDNHEYFTSFLKKQNNDRKKKLSEIIKRNQETQFIYNDKKEDIYDKDNSNRKEYINNFYETNKINIIDEIVENDTRVYIIQDYMTLRLSEKIKYYIDKAKNKIDLYFLTDIRTSILGDGEGPSDLDILWNSALQMIFLKTLRPIHSMLKYRTPFFADKDKLKKANWEEYVTKDLEYVRDNYGIDFLKDYFNNKFTYFEDDLVLVQPWAPNKSSETRMFIPESKIDGPYKVLSHIEHENKMFLLTLLRVHKYYGIFYDVVKEHEIWDGCQDCARELYIISLYLIKTETKNLREIDYDDYNKSIDIMVKLLKTESFMESALRIYRVLNEHTFFDLSKRNYKCPYHGNMKEQKKDIRITVGNAEDDITENFDFSIK